MWTSQLEEKGEKNKEILGESFFFFVIIFAGADAQESVFVSGERKQFYIRRLLKLFPPRPRTTRGNLTHIFPWPFWEIVAIHFPPPFLHLLCPIFYPRFINSHTVRKGRDGEKWPMELNGMASQAKRPLIFSLMFLITGLWAMRSSLAQTALLSSWSGRRIAHIAHQMQE